MSRPKWKAVCTSILAAIWSTSTSLGAQVIVDLAVEDQPLNTAFEEVFRVGGLEAADWESFGNVEATAFDAEGNLYIFDEMLSRITVVDEQGQFVRTVGGPGEGPGELRVPLGFTALPDGRVLVSDMALQGYQLFASDGKLERIISMGALLRVGELHPDPRGGAVYSGGEIIPLGFGTGSPAGGDVSPGIRPIERIALDGTGPGAEVVIEGWMPPRGEPPTLAADGLRFAMESAMPRAFEPELLFGALPDGALAFSDSSAYVVKVASPDGTLLRVIRRPFSPEPMTRAMQDTERTKRLAALEADVGPGPQSGMFGADAIKEMLRDQLEQMEFFHELPVIMDLKTSWGGAIWVQRRGEEPTEPGPIDVLTPAGQYLGTFVAGALEMPSSFGPNGIAAFIVTDEFDVRTVVVCRLPAVLN